MFRIPVSHRSFGQNYIIQVRYWVVVRLSKLFSLSLSLPLSPSLYISLPLPPLSFFAYLLMLPISMFSIQSIASS